jgi:hypothetical protein
MGFTGEAGVGENLYQAVGSGSTTGSSTTPIITVDLQGNERAARFRGRVVSASGERRDIEAIGYMVPEEGWVVHDSGIDCALTATGTTVEFSVVGESGSDFWIGHLEISFTQDYAA